MITKKKTAKGKSRVQRAREYTLAIYAFSCQDLVELIKRLPDKPTRQKVKEMLNARFDVSLDAADTFDIRWEAAKGRFIEEEE